MAAIPEEYTGLFARGTYGHLATVAPDGRPHAVPVWTDYDGEHILLNLDRRDQPVINVVGDPRVALSILYPGDPHRHLAIRGEVVEMTTEGAVAHVKALAELYYGDSHHSWQFDAPAAERVLLRIRADDVETTGNLKEQLPFDG